jgi:hypothetical protein
MNSELLRLKVEVLYECVKGFIERSDKSLLPAFMMSVVDVKPDGSCQFRALANNVNHFKNENRSEMNLAKKMYSIIKHTVVNILPFLSNEDLISDFGF